MKVYRSKKAQKNIERTYDILLAMWGVEVTQNDVPTSYGTTHVISCGKEDKPALVLFHGVGDDSALMWIYNAKALSEHFHVFAVDTLGGPGKSRPNQNYTEKFDDVQWLDEVMDALGLTRMYLAGVSNGAYLTQLYGAARPERVIKMVCMAGSVPAGEGGSHMKAMMRIFLPEALFPTQGNVVRLIRKLTGGNSRVFLDNPAIMEHYRYLLGGFHNMAMRYHKISRFRDAQIDTLRDKILFLVGEDDPFALLGGKAMLERYHMNARFFKQVGHGINHEMADEVNRILIEYLADPGK